VNCEPCLGVALLFDLGLLAAKCAQVVQLGATNISARDDLNVVDYWGVNGEGTLDAHLEAHLADREGLTNAVARTTDYDALEHLNTRARTFDDVYVNLDVVAGTELRNVVFEGRLVDAIEDMHD